MILRCVAARSGPLRSFLRGELGLSSTLVKGGKAAGIFRVNGVPALLNWPVAPGDVVEAVLTEPPASLPPEPGPLEILYEDEALLAVDKPPGLWVHPTAARQEGTLANRVAAYYAGRGLACGIHVATRLDRDTFGVVLLAKHGHVHSRLGALQAAGRLEKTYLAAVLGAPPAEAGVVALPIARRGGGSLLREVSPAGQAAETAYRLLAQSGGVSLLALTPRTGRTHQLRVHCAALGCPILGDRDYGDADARACAEALGLAGQQLCAWRLRLSHPLTGERLEIRSRQGPQFPDWAKFLPETS